MQVGSRAGRRTAGWQTWRGRALACAGLLAAATLSGCGFNYATDRVYTPGNGANYNEDESVTVLHAAVVSTEPGSGTFIATLTNKDTQEPVVFDSLTGGGEGEVADAEVTPVEIAPGGFVSLADEGGVPVTGDFSAGGFVDVVVGFDRGYQIALEVPVVANEGYFAGLDGPAPPTEGINERLSEPEAEPASEPAAESE